MKKLATLCLLFAALAGAGCTGKTEKKSASKGPVPMYKGDNEALPEK